MSIGDHCWRELLSFSPLIYAPALYCFFTQVQFEAKRSMEILDDRMVDGFQALLLTTKPMLRTFDHVFQ